MARSPTKYPDEDPSRPRGTASHLTDEERYALVRDLLLRPRTGVSYAQIGRDHNVGRQSILNYKRTLVLMGLDPKVPRTNEEINDALDHFMTMVHKDRFKVAPDQTLLLSDGPKVKGNFATGRFHLPEPKTDLQDDLTPEEQRQILIRLAQQGTTTPRDKIGIIQLLAKLDAEQRPTAVFQPPEPLTTSDKVSRLCRLFSVLTKDIVQEAMDQTWPVSSSSPGSTPNSTKESTTPPSTSETTPSPVSYSPADGTSES